MVALAVPLYLVGSFVAGSFNPNTWDTFGKIILSVFYLTIVFGIVINGALDK